MNKRVTRRDFGKLSAAAFGGVVVGAAFTGCGGKEDKDTSQDGTTTTDVDLLLEEPHVCRGLNSCKEKGGCKTATSTCSGKNDCAGSGGCATAEKHGCNEANACKGQGGCGATAGINACKGKGACGVPLKADTWKKVREKFETVYEKKNGKKPNPAPAR